ncbi:MAG: flagellar protein FlaG [Proteobacteria bacterium]|nr:flagellar protein FlaG [Pseudomonadota bacterium]
MKLPPSDSEVGIKAVTVKYSVDPSKGLVQARVVDSKTERVVREIPSDQQVQVRESLAKIVDEVV